MLRVVRVTCRRCKCDWKLVCRDGTPECVYECMSASCSSQQFGIERDSAETIDWQRVRLQELASDEGEWQGGERSAHGRIPLTKDVEVYGDQVDKCVPGDRVVVTGIVRVVSVSERRGVARSENPFALVSLSICPVICGQYMVKAGLTLAMFGGCSSEEGWLTDEDDIHVLILGDPGLGKSQLLSHVASLSPRGVYVCGSYASAAGLTVSIHKEPGTQDYALEAGALILANNGIACIDELDKMPHQVDALLEAMEQQRVSVAKAGIICNLPAHASIIAAANPKHGHYNKTKTVSENLNMSSALLSRFDLIFVLVDHVDANHDEQVSSHIMAHHLCKKHPGTPEKAPDSNKEVAARAESAPPFPSLYQSLSSFSKTNPPLLNSDLLSRYVLYSKTYVRPSLTWSARKLLQNFYLSLRRSQRAQDGTPVTTRQLESLIRLSEARAKADLREQVTENDAREAIEIMRSSLSDAFDDELIARGTLGHEGSVDVYATGKRGRLKKSQRFVSMLQTAARSLGKIEWTTQELYAFLKENDLSVPASSFEEFVESLNYQGYLLRSKKNTWKLYGI
ncbi:DNA helicase MCM8-like [Schistocerca gregaria]|uniref:DNA helicase MCM8-like n=1 Tax=Schistocerca gregaria TaxID=7010 RepID=UPI00211E49BD|nr:DNA helicase MCM8-like [Schistocerca gregaria]